MDNNFNINDYKVSSYEEYLKTGQVTKAPIETITMGTKTIQKRLKVTEVSFWNPKTKKYLFRPKTNSLKVFFPANKEVPDIFEVLEDNKTDVGTFMYIARYIDNNNMIHYCDKHTKQAVPANSVLLKKMISKNDEVGRKFIKKLIDKGLILFSPLMKLESCL